MILQITDENNVPESERSPSLKAWLAEQAATVSSVIAKREDIAYQDTVFYFLCLPWLSDSGGNVEREALLNQQRKDFFALGFNGDAVKQGLEKILEEDAHLKKCCINALMLAQFLGGKFIDQMALLHRQTAFTNEQLDHLFEIFAAETYGQKFRHLAFSHLYNFDSDERFLNLGEICIERLDASLISPLLGERTNYSFLHPPGVGEYFIITETDQPDNVVQWLYEQRYKAEELARVLQYFKDGVIHVDYTVPYFLPNWVNALRRNGIFFLGEPHRTPYVNGQHFYRLTSGEIEQFKAWLSVSRQPDIVQKLEDERTKLRQAIIRAGDNYEGSFKRKDEGTHPRTDVINRLGDLIISLESLFSPPDKGEIKFRMALATSQLLIDDDGEREEVFDFVDEMYSRRNKLFHGSYDVNAYYEGRFVSNEEVEKLASIVRRAILRFMVFYLKGHDKREPIVEKLNRSAINPAIAKYLREESDPSKFISERIAAS